MRRVYRTLEFEKQLRKRCSPEEYKGFENIEARIAMGRLRGDLLGPVWFAEIRIGTKRAYFLRNDVCAVFIGITGKKDQQEFIDSVRREKEMWLGVLKSYQ